MIDIREDLVQLARMAFFHQGLTPQGHRPYDAEGQMLADVILAHYTLTPKEHA